LFDVTQNMLNIKLYFLLTFRIINQKEGNVAIDQLLSDVSDYYQMFPIPAIVAGFQVFSPIRAAGTHAPSQRLKYHKICLL
jgi:hypothetical protein